MEEGTGEPLRRDSTRRQSRLASFYTLGMCLEKEDTDCVPRSPCPGLFGGGASHRKGAGHTAGERHRRGVDGEGDDTAIIGDGGRGVEEVRGGCVGGDHMGNPPRWLGRMWTVGIDVIGTQAGVQLILLLQKKDPFWKFLPINGPQNEAGA